VAYDTIDRCHKEAPLVASWSNDGLYFIVKDKAAFEKDYLVTKYTSFVKQLNNYGFKNINSEMGHSKERDAFRHSSFKKDQKELLKNVRLNQSTGPKKSWNKNDIEKVQECIKKLQSLVAHAPSRPVSPDSSLDEIPEETVIYRITQKEQNFQKEENDRLTTENNRLTDENNRLTSENTRLLNANKRLSEEIKVITDNIKLCGTPNEVVFMECDSPDGSGETSFDPLHDPQLQLNGIGSGHGTRGLPTEHSKANKHRPGLFRCVRSMFGRLSGKKSQS